MFRNDIIVNKTLSFCDPNPLVWFVFFKTKCYYSFKIDSAVISPNSSSYANPHDINKLLWQSVSHLKKKIGFISSFRFCLFVNCCGRGFPQILCHYDYFPSQENLTFNINLRKLVRAKCVRCPGGVEDELRGKPSNH